MGSFTYFFVLIAFSVVKADLPCASWSRIERELIHEAQQVNCTVYNNCTGISCSIHQNGYAVDGGLYINPCDNPPCVNLSLDVPKLNINKLRKKFCHGEKFSLTETLEGVIEINRENKRLILGLLLDIPTGIKPNSPLLHLIPSLASKTQFHVLQNIAIDIPSCLQLQNNSNMKHEMHKSVTPLLPTSFPTFLSKDQIQSNCSILNSSCTVNEMCKQISISSPDGICVCVTDFTRNVDGKCIYNPSESTTTEIPGGHSEPSKRGSTTSLLLTAILVPIAVIVLAVLFVYAAIRFRIFQHLRRRLRVQVYEHVLLGQEDDDESLNPVA